MLVTQIVAILEKYIPEELVQQARSEVDEYSRGFKIGSDVIMNGPCETNPEETTSIYCTIVATEPKKYLLTSKSCEKRFWLSDKEMAILCWPTK